MQFVSSAKQEAITHIRKTTGMLIELIPQLLKGGTPIQLKWQRGCHSDNRGAIYQLIKKVEDRENYEKLLQDLNIMFSVTQGIRGDVNTDKLKQIGIDIMAYLRTAFLNNIRKPWININPSLH